MAEFVGLVASSIELGRAVAGLVQFCALVKHAPQQLVAIKEDALLLEIVLKTLMKLGENGPDLTATEEWDICHRHCMALTSDLQRLLSDLEGKVVQHKVFGSIESVLKRHRVQELQERLRDAKANLGLLMSSRNLTNAFAVQVYKQHTQFSSMLAAHSSQLEILVAGQQQFTDSSNSLQRGCLSTQLSCRGTSHETSVPTFPMMNVPRKTESDTQNYYHQKRLRFFNWAAQISIARSFGKWQYTLETYSLAHINDDVFYYARTGNISMLQELFSSKAVSPFVRSYGHGENEVTLLHHAIEYLQVPTAQFLMSQRLDVNALGKVYPGTLSSCFVFLKLALLRSILTGSCGARSSLLDMTRTIVGNPHCALLIGESAHERLEEWNGPSSDYGINDRRGLEVDNILQGSIFPPVNTLPLDMRLRRTCRAMRNSIVDEFDISSIWDHLGQESFDEQCIDLAMDSNHDLDPLNSVWSALGHAKSSEQKEATHNQVAVWREILRQLIDNGASRLILWRPDTYLLQFCRSKVEASVSRVAGWLEDMVTSWFLELKLAEMDEDDMTELRQGFEQHHWGAFVNFLTSKLCRDCYIRCGTTLRFTGFHYEPASGKVRIWSSPIWDETAADFWHRVEADPSAPDEDATCYIPGQWPSQDKQRELANPSIEDKRLESAILYYSQSKRRRGRIARYYGIQRKDIDAEFGVSRDECSSGSIFPAHISSRVKQAVRQRLERNRAKCRPRSRPYMHVNFSDATTQDYGREYDLSCSWTILRVWGRGELWPDGDSKNE